jgi:uncharacterized membrane protein
MVIAKIFVAVCYVFGWLGLILSLVWLIINSVMLIYLKTSKKETGGRSYFKKPLLLLAFSLVALFLIPAVATNLLGYGPFSTHNSKPTLPPQTGEGIG